MTGDAFAKVTPSISALFDPQSQFNKERAAKARRAEHECVLMLLECYLGVLDRLGGGPSAAWRLFNGFTNAVAKSQVPRKGRGPGKKYAERDRQLVAARRAAPKGQIEAAIAGVSGGEAHNNAARHARRLTERDRKRDRTIKEFGTAIGDALRNGDDAKARELIFEELPKALGTPDK